MSKKSDKKKPAKSAEPAGVTVSISAHPRAKAGIRRARTRAALIAFALVLVLNLAGDQTAFDATWRALIAGIVVNVIAWRCAIMVWRHIVISEVRQLEEERAEQRREQREKLEALAAEQANAAGFKVA
jgi:type VI protein secretion system component VasK